MRSRICGVRLRETDSSPALRNFRLTRSGRVIGARLQFSPRIRSACLFRLTIRQWYGDHLLKELIRSCLTRKGVDSDRWWEPWRIWRGCCRELDCSDREVGDGPWDGWRKPCL